LDVVERRSLLGEDAGEGGRDAGAIRSGDGDEHAIGVGHDGRARQSSPNRAARRRYRFAGAAVVVAGATGGAAAAAGGSACRGEAFALAATCSRRDTATRARQRSAPSAVGKRRKRSW